PPYSARPRGRSSAGSWRTPCPPSWAARRRWPAWADRTGASASPAPRPRRTRRPSGETGIRPRAPARGAADARPHLGAGGTVQLSDARELRLRLEGIGRLRQPGCVQAGCRRLRQEVCDPGGLRRVERARALAGQRELPAASGAVLGAVGGGNRQEADHVLHDLWNGAGLFRIRHVHGAESAALPVIEADMKSTPSTRIRERVALGFTLVEDVVYL